MLSIGVVNSSLRSRKVERMKKIILGVALCGLSALWAFDGTTCFSLTKISKPSYPSGFNLADLTGFGVTIAGFESRFSDIDPADCWYDPSIGAVEGVYPWPTWFVETDAPTVKMSLKAPRAGCFYVYFPTYWTGFNPKFATWTVTGGTLVEVGPSPYYNYVLIRTTGPGAVTLNGAVKSGSGLDDYLGRASIFFFPESGNSVYLTANYSAEVYPGKSATEIKKIMDQDQPVRKAGGWVKGSGLYFPGSTAVLTALPVPDCAFDHWEVRSDNETFNPDGVAALKAAIAGKEKNATLSFTVTDEICVPSDEAEMYIPETVYKECTRCAFLNLRAVWRSASTSLSAPWMKARKLAIVLGTDVPSSIVQLKIGKANAKTRKVKVSGSLVGLDGKKVSLKAATGTVADDKVTVSLVVPGAGPLVVTVSGAGVVAAAKGAERLSKVAAGGALAGTAHAVSLPAVSFTPGQLDDLVPAERGEAFTVAGGKWSFPKASKVKFDKKTGKLVVDTEGGKTNLSGMKISYKPATGTFKGAFKVYSFENAKLKKVKVQVTGLVAGGRGYGQAICKKPASGPWPVMVK